MARCDIEIFNVGTPDAQAVLEGAEIGLLGTAVSAPTVSTDVDVSLFGRAIACEAAELEQPDVIVYQDGSGDYATITAAVNAATPGNSIRRISVRATNGTSAQYTENVRVWNKNFSAGDELHIYAEPGQNISIVSADADEALVDVADSSYIVFEGFVRLGARTWTNAVPVESSSPYNHRYSVVARSNSHHIDFRSLGRFQRQNDNKVFGANNYTASRAGGFDDDDGCHHVRFWDCHFDLHGSNNNTGGTSGNWGDALRITAPNSVVDTVSSYQAGHNTIHMMERKCLVRNTLADNSWAGRGTGQPGYRVAAVSMDVANILPDGTPDIVVEDCVWRNGLDGEAHNHPPVIKYQANRGIFRFNYHITGDGAAYLIDRNNGSGGNFSGTEKGDVTESKFYHNTAYGTDSIARTVENATGLYFDLFFEQSFVNELYQNLGEGDNLSADVYVYKTDKTDTGVYGDAWKGDQWRSITVQTDNLSEFNIRLEGQSSASKQTLSTWIATRPDVFVDWDVETVSFSGPSTALSNWNISNIKGGLRVTSGATVLNNAQHLTTMVGGGSGTSGVLQDPRFFALLDTDFDLGYFGYENDQIAIGGQIVRLLTLNYETGAATWDTSIEWIDGELVYFVPSWTGAIPVHRGANQS